MFLESASTSHSSENPPPQLMEEEPNAQGSNEHLQQGGRDAQEESEEIKREEKEQDIQNPQETSDLKTDTSSQDLFENLDDKGDDKKEEPSEQPKNEIPQPTTGAEHHGAAVLPTTLAQLAVTQPTTMAQASIETLSAVASNLPHTVQTAMVQPIQVVYAQLPVEQQQYQPYVTEAHMIAPQQQQNVDSVPSTPYMAPAATDQQHFQQHYDPNGRAIPQYANHHQAFDPEQMGYPPHDPQQNLAAPGVYTYTTPGKKFFNLSD